MSEIAGGSVSLQLLPRVLSLKLVAAFITEKEELKPGLILFRRGDVGHRMWYCRMNMPKADRYKTVSLKTTDISAARERAFDQGYGCPVAHQA
jgi:hypothetical protein